METPAAGTPGPQPAPRPELPTQPVPENRFTLPLWARRSIQAVCLLVLVGSLLWIWVGWPLPMRLWVGLVLLAGCSLFGFIALFVSDELPRWLTRGLAAGTGLIVLIATVLAVQGTTGSSSESGGGQAAPQTSSRAGGPASPPAPGESRPSSEPDPLITTTDFDMDDCENYTIPGSFVPSLPKKNTGFDPEWIYKNGGATSGKFELTVEGKTDAAVVLKRFRVIDVKRKSIPADAVNLLSCGPSGGAVTVRQFEVNMSDPLTFTPVPGEDPNTGDEVPGVDFPFKVSNNDPEVFLLWPTSATCFCEWRLAIDWTSGGRSGTTIVDRGFGPIISDPSQDARPLIYFENGDWHKQNN
jgi:hypothetical protein